MARIKRSKRAKHRVFWKERDGRLRWHTSFDLCECMILFKVQSAAGLTTWVSENIK